MKVNKISRSRHRFGMIAVISIATFAAIAIGITAAYRQLAGIWTRQCLITDVTSQVEITDGTMVRGAAVLDALGVRNGVNLADIDFTARRDELLSRIPNIRDIRITRLVPDRLRIEVEERTPIVQLGVHAQPARTGRVTDTDGIVFTCRRGTGMLPVLRERASSVTPVGQRLHGRSLAALRLLETASAAEYAPLAVLEADISNADFILITLGSYAQAKIAWSGMDDPTEATRQDLVRRLTHLRQAIQSNVGSNAKMWNATEPNRVYADTRETIL